MRKYIFIGCGGFIGAVLRYLVEEIKIYDYHENVPLNTLLINIVGAFLLALILTTAYEVRTFDSDLRLGLTTGVLGAFTTFSTLCKETVMLFSSGDYFSAISYVTVSSLLGLTVVYFGVVVAREIGARLLRKDDKDDMIENESDVN